MYVFLSLYNNVATVNNAVFYNVTARASSDKCNRFGITLSAFPQDRGQKCTDVRNIHSNMKKDDVDSLHIAVCIHQTTGSGLPQDRSASTR